eukprot:GFUD01005471.1.p1 GENE.GFUD01005471.1~~GFUD01005471.1.p1  ORF type:complete len:776 (+),score=261.45 GFUD01005471.1:80-2407(+)
MQALHGGGVGGVGQADQQQLLQPDSGHRVEPGQQQQQQGLWSGQIQQGFDHPGLQQHQLQQLHQHQQQQQLQHQLLLGGHGNLAPLVGQQISQLLGPGQQHQSPPGLGPTLNMMLGGPHVSMGPMFPGQAVQSPPSSTGQFLLLPGTQQQRPGIAPGQADNAVSPNSTPGLQTPTPSATPPIMNFDNRDSSLFMGTSGRLVTGQDLEQAGEMEQAMAWRGLQALQGGTLADMFPSMDRQMGQFGGMDRQMGHGGHPGAMDRGMGHAGYPGAMPGTNGQGFNNYTVAMAQAQAAQAQENMMRLQQLQQSQEFLPKQHHVPLHQLQQYQAGPPMMAQPDMSRQYPGFPPPQCQSPSPNGFSLPPGPRPRPVGGDSSPPGYTPDTLPHSLAEEAGHVKEQEQQQLVIGSWNEEIDKETVTTVAQPSVAHNLVAPPAVVHNLSQPPPRHGQPEQEWGGTFHVPRGGGHNWGGGEFVSNEIKTGGRGAENTQAQDAENRGKRGGRGGRGTPAPRGRGGQHRSDMDHTQEKANGKNNAIEETKAMMLKMRLEEKEMMSKYKKEKGIPEEEVPEENKIQPGAYRPRERRGRDDRKDGQRGRGGRGRGRGGPPMPCPGGPMPPMFGLPYVPGDFRTPPFPGMEGFLPPPGLGQFPPGFPPHFAPGFPPGIFPGAFPGDMRGRGGFNRGGRGFPVGFPPRGFPPPIIGSRGGRGGRGGYQPGGREKEFRGEGGEDGEENPLLTAIEGNKVEGVENPETEVAEQEQENVAVAPVAAVAGLEVADE